MSNFGGKMIRRWFANRRVSLLPSLFTNPAPKLLALALAVLLWGVANTSSSVERGYDIPVILRGIPSDMVITGLSVDQINVRVMGSRAALRNLGMNDLEYEIEVSDANIGLTTHEVELSDFEIARGARVVSRSPSRIEFNVARRGNRLVPVRVDLEGQPASGYTVSSVEVSPDTVSITGARTEVNRLREVVTETIILEGAKQTIDREVRLSIGRGHVWLKEPVEIRVRINIQMDDNREGVPNRETS